MIQQLAYLALPMAYKPADLYVLLYCTLSQLHNFHLQNFVSNAIQTSKIADIDEGPIE